MSAAALIIAGVAVGIACLAALVAIPVFIIKFARSASRPFPDGVITTAEVIDHELLPTGVAPHGGHMLVPVYRFVDEHGTTRIGRDQIGDSGRIPVGSAMRVSYRPHNPARVRRLDQHRPATGLTV